jgi:DNA-binding response OmpR family regulator
MREVGNNVSSPAENVETRGTVLVVDDDEFSASIYEAILNDIGFAVRTADSGEKALETFDSAAIRLVVVDSRLPGMSGAELVQRLRAKDSRVPVLGLSGFAPGAPCNAEFEAAVTEYQPKTDDLDELEAVFRRYAS